MVLLQIIVRDMKGIEFQIEIDNNSTVSTLPTIIYKKNVELDNFSNGIKYVSEIYDIKNDTEKLNWGTANKELTLLDNDINNNTVLFIIYSKTEPEDFPLQFTIILKDMTGIKKEITVNSKIDLSIIAKKWNELTELSAAEIFIHGVEDALNWNHKVGHYNLKELSELFIICNDEHINYNLYKHHSVENYCKECHCTIFENKRCFDCFNITIYLKDEFGLQKDITVSLETLLSDIAKQWNTLTGLSTSNIFLQGNVDKQVPLNWNKTILENNITKNSKLLMICNNKHINYNLHIHGSISNYCDDCHGTTFCRIGCIYCASKHGINVCDHCFGGDNMVQLENGTQTYIKDLVIGDKVRSKYGYSTISKVLYTDKTMRLVCNLDGLIITDTHPINIDNKWIYPKDISNVYKDYLEVYNFEMEGNHNNKDIHTIYVNGMLCATLGCGPDELAIRNPEDDSKFGNGYCWSTN
jgi:hypothetical protein